MIVIVRAKEFLIIGKEAEDQDEQPGYILRNPKILADTPKGLAFVPFIGDPLELDIAEYTFRYEVREADTINRYQASVTGIIVAQPNNVIDITKR
jgi:hypothetical protein